MASEANKNVQTKADVILQNGLVLDKKVENIAIQTSNVANDMEAVKKACERTVTEQGFIARQNSEIFEKLSGENKALKQELMFLSAQSESIYTGIAKLVSKLQDEVVALKKQIEENEASRVEEKTESVEPLEEEVEVLGDDEAIEEIVPEIDYDVIAEKIAGQIVVPAPENVEIDYDKLSAKVAEKINVGVSSDEICNKVYEKLLPAVQSVGVQEVISPDYIASKVAEQIIIPASVNTNGSYTDYNAMADRIVNQVVERLGQSSVSAIDQSDLLAVAAAPAVDEETLAQRLADRVADMLDSDDFVDRLVKKVGTVSPEDFDVMVDDDGCDALAESLCAKLDYDLLSEKLAARINDGAFNVEAKVDEDELANKVSEKVNVVVDEVAIADRVSEKVSVIVDEEAIANKVSENLQDKLPKVDEDSVAQTVIESVVRAIPVPAVVNEEAIANTVADKLAENNERKEPEKEDYDIVIDEEGVEKITLLVSEKVQTGNNARFDKIDEEIENLKQMLSGAMVVANDESAIADDDDELVKVSDIIGDEETETITEEDDVLQDIDEQPAEGEVVTDEIPEISNGVDFGNMMKYNRSFIARIIQSSDDMKRYYGETKSALLAYKKVNSNVAWGAERFNKGRETIARFKIRGKTLCLYLALDPNEYKTSVYHHLDVSDNKSMNGTPMMVKIKSPLGVKKAIRLIDEMLEKRGGIKQAVQERDYAAMYPYETIEELIEDGLVKDVSKK